MYVMLALNIFAIISTTHRSNDINTATPVTETSKSVTNITGSNSHTAVYMYMLCLKELNIRVTYAAGVEAGEYLQASWLLFPAATEKCIP